MTNKTNINSLETFALAVKEYFMAAYQISDIRLNRVSKNNGVTLMGLCIMNPDSNIAPNIYLETFYEEYLNGKPLSEIAVEILRINRQNQMEHFPAYPLQSFDAVMNKVVYRLVNKEKNTERLHNIPYVDYMDLAVIFCIVLDETREGIASVTVTNDMMKCWNISIEELYGIAHKNTVKKFPVLLKSMEEILLESIVSLNTYDTEESGCAIPMYVLTNMKKLNGAAVVLYDNQLRNLAEYFGGDYFLLPSSIHETLLIPVMDATDNPSELKEMVMDVNKVCVRDEEFLSDSVYRYFKDEECLRIVA